MAHLNKTRSGVTITGFQWGDLSYIVTYILLYFNEMTVTHMYKLMNCNARIIRMIVTHKLLDCNEMIVTP